MTLRIPTSHLRRRTILGLILLEARVTPADMSAPAILQWFDGSDATVERRAVDVFNTGYGQVLMPPPGRADSGDQSVGYDVYDRFDLGSPTHHTLYGTELGLKTVISAIHQIGDNFYSDLVWNHDGFSNSSSVDGNGNSFVNAGGYPGFAITLNSGNNGQGYTDQDGDFHSAFDSGDFNGQLSGLIDIAQEKNYQFIRSPIGPDSRNLPAGTAPAFGRLANVSDPKNARFYPDQGLNPIIVYDPTTGEQNLRIYPFNTANPLAGDATPENVLGYLMRYAQWMVQVNGADGFRIDAEKHMPQWVMNYLDRAVYRESTRFNLDGSQENPFSFGEVFDGNMANLQSYVRKDINPSNPGTIGGNRDVLDFPLYFAMSSNLTNNGLANDWRNIKNASFDVNDDGLANNGSQGVSFVASADSFAPYLSNVAYAYTLMRPGNAIVYYNGHEFGNRDFPKDGRGDALCGLYGNLISTLVDIRNTHGRGNYIDRTPAADAKEMLIYERQDSALVVLSNRLDGGFDSRTVQTGFAPGTPLIELTGNASDATVDPFDDFPSLLVVNSDGTVNLRVPRNSNPNGVEHDKGYFIYGVSGPQGSLNLTNVDHVIAGQTPTADTNGTARLSSIDVMTGNTFELQLNTNQVNLLGTLHDHDADGDNAIFKIDDGVDVTGGGFVSTTPGDVAYGFQQFQTVHNPGYFTVSNNGQYAQTIDVSKLSEGMHTITVRAFRHRNTGEPAVFTDFKQAVYVDRSKTRSALVSFSPIVLGVNENRRATVRSADLEANNVHIFLDLPAGLTDAQVIAMVGPGSQANQIDRDLWTRDFSGVTSGNHVITVVSFEISGNATVQRFAGQLTATIFGAGLGDLNFDGQYSSADVSLFNGVLTSSNAQFNPAADLNGDGLVNNSDLVLLHDRLIAIGADAATLAAYQNLLGPPAAGFHIAEGQSLSLSANQPNGSVPALSFSWDLNNDGNFGDALGANPTITWSQLQALGITDNGSFPIKLRVSGGVDTTIFGSTLLVDNAPPTATFSNNGPLPVHQPVTLSFGSQFDPSNADTAAGFRYSYDFNNDGTFDVVDSTAASVQHVFPHVGTFPVRGRIKDKDGGFTDSTTSVVVTKGNLLVTGADAGGGPQVVARDALTNAIKFSFFAFAPDFAGGVRVASGDVNGDGVTDIIVAAGGGGGPHVRVLDGNDLHEIAGFFAYSPAFTGGVYLAVGDVNGDGHDDIITGAGPGGGPHVKVIDGTKLNQILPNGQIADSALLASFFAYDVSFTGGVRVAAGDVNGDGKADVVTGAGPGGGPHVRVFNGSNVGNVLFSFFAFDASFAGGVFVAAGDVDGDGKAEMLVSQDTTAVGPRVRKFDGATGSLLADFAPFPGNTGRGVRVALIDRDGDGLTDLAASSGFGAPSMVKSFKGTTLAPLGQFAAFDPGFLGGVFVG